MQVDQLARIAAQASSEKLGENTLLIDVGEVIGITEYFVITTGNNRRHIKSIIEGIEEELSSKADSKPICIEGKESSGWVLMDYGAFVVHVFDHQCRTFYDLERLWSDRPKASWD
tara:strand:- start:1097 stop:1441 length:345 start_codon:yes stop_codon:yes gene_type:complete